MSAQILANRLIRVFVGITVALGIASVLVVSVVQKSKEIGILRAMGAARAQVLRVFLIQGAFMGLTGAVFGSALAWGFLMLWRGIARNADGTPLFIVAIEPSLFAIACAGSMVVGLLAAAVPARRAALRPHRRAGRRTYRLRQSQFERRLRRRPRRWPATFPPVLTSVPVVLWRLEGVVATIRTRAACHV